MSVKLSNTTNYLIPAAGQTHCVNVNEIFSPTPLFIDWRQFQIDNFPFRPQGVFIDNSLGIDALRIEISPLGYVVECEAGAMGQFQFPAPSGQTCNITGNGSAKLYFVDFPVLPTAQTLKIVGTNDVNIKSVDSAIIFDTNILPGTFEHLHGTGTGSGANAVTLTPLTSTKLRKLIISIDNDAVTASGFTLTATLNGVTIWQRYFSQLVATGAHSNTNQDFDLVFDVIAPDAGAGDLIVSSSVAFTASFFEINAYFGA